MRVINKRGQFFLLGAIIIAAMLFSLGAVSNKLTVARDYSGFDGHFDNIYRESNAVLSYAINSGSDIETVMGDFGNRLSVDVQNRNLNADFLLIYGNSSKLVIENLGLNNVVISGDSSPAVPSQIMVAVAGVSGSQTLAAGNNLSIVPTGDLEILYNDNIYNFVVSDNNRVITMLKEEFNDEIYIRVK